MRYSLPSDEQLRASLKEFASLLEATAKESAWQAFFATNPHIFARGLPLRLEPGDFTPLGRPGKSEPDFIFFDRQNPTKTYGVIELKRPDDPVIVVPRRKLIKLSESASTAVVQLKEYGRSLERRILGDELNSSLMFGNRAHLFAIMGLREREAARIVQSVSELQLNELMPADVRFLGYDDLFKNYERSLPSRCMVLVPLISSGYIMRRLEIETIDEVWEVPEQFDKQLSTTHLVPSTHETYRVTYSFPYWVVRILIYRRRRVTGASRMLLGSSFEWRIAVFDKEKRERDLPLVVVSCEGQIVTAVHHPPTYEGALSANYIDMLKDPTWPSTAGELLAGFDQYAEVDIPPEPYGGPDHM